MGLSGKEAGLKRHLRNILLYTLPAFADKGAGFVLVPLYVSQLKVSEFGLLELSQVLSLFLVYLLHAGWSSAFVRYYHEDGVDRNNLVRTLLVFRAIVGVAVTVSWFVIGPSRIAAWLGMPKELTTGMTAVVCGFLIRDFLTFYESKFRCEERAGAFALFSTANAVLQVMCVSYLVVIRHMGVTGVLVGSAAALVPSALFLMAVEGGWFVKGRFDTSILRRILNYGLPLAPAAVAMFVILSSDRLMLQRLLSDGRGLEELGRYGFAARLVSALQLITVGTSTFLGPFVARHCTDPNSPSKFIFLFRNYTSVLLTAALTGLAVLPAVARFFPDYAPAATTTALLTAGFLVYHIGDFFCIGLVKAEHNGVRAKAGCLAATMNLVLNFFFIPQWGAAGAAAATMMSYVGYTGWLMVASHRYVAVRYDWWLWIGGTMYVAGAAVLLGWTDFDVVIGWVYAMVGLGLVIGRYLLTGGWKLDERKAQESCAA